MASSLAELQRRVARLEQVRKPAWSRPVPTVPRDAQYVRATIERVWEAGGFYKPPVGSNCWRFRERMKAEYGLTDEDFRPHPPESRYTDSPPRTPKPEPDTEFTPRVERVAGV